ncbi:MAG: xanthine dehydrogenase family protein molybdopterin-binding subunit [Acidiferrobacterales bacterium]|nr:xanthine dehydrogenase family protein molybdopterin-binding subunit [Acidiferrobacterales bacterium]
MNTRITRRDFIKSVSAASAYSLVLGYLPGRVLASSQSKQAASLTPFLKISENGTVTVIIKHFECGQGTATGLATLIGEELGVALEELEIEFAPLNPELYANLLFGIQATGGSTSLANSFIQYRQAGAAARQMLLTAAAQSWQVSSSDLTLANGRVSGAGKSAPIAEFVAAAASMDVPAEPKLKSPQDFTLIGNPNTARLDNVPKVTGTARYSLDVHLDNQMVAVMLRSPKFGGKAISMNTDDAAKVAGFINAAILPTGTAVVVYAQDTWSALEARKAIAVEWDFSSAETRSSDKINADYLAMVNDEPQFVARDDTEGAKQSLFNSAAQVIERDFTFPYLAHATMEPMNCTIEPTADGIIVHDGCQAPSAVQQVMTAVLKLPAEKVKVNTLYAGGSFGRRFTVTSDYHVEAALAFALSGGKRPVKLIWSREDDLGGGSYRPGGAHRVRIALNAEGKIVAWDHRIAVQPIFKGTPMESMVVRNGVDSSSVEGVADTVYDIPGLFVGLTDASSPVTVNWWRSVGHSHTAFVMESMMDIAASATGRDPVEFRLAHLSGGNPDQVRLANVLRLAAEKSEWQSSPVAGRSRGVAAHKSFGTYVAEVVEISRSDDDRVKIERVTCAVDCGLAVNPDVVTAQMESGIGYGIGHVMRNEITFSDGVVNQSNFPTYMPLRISDIAHIETHIVASAEHPTGVGEPSTPPAGPALANAIAVDGPRITHLPLTAGGVQFA